MISFCPPKTSNTEEAVCVVCSPIAIHKRQSTAGTKNLQCPAVLMFWSPGCQHVGVQDGPTWSCRQWRCPHGPTDWLRWNPDSTQMGVASSTPCVVSAAAADPRPTLEPASSSLPSSATKCPNLSISNNSCWRKEHNSLGSAYKHTICAACSS